MKATFGMIIVASLALIAATPVPPTRAFSIGGTLITEAEVVDARAQPELDGTASVLVTFDEKAAARLAALVAGQNGKPVDIRLNDMLLLNAPIALAEGALLIPLGTALPKAIAIARQISGKDPLPDSLEE